MREEAGNRCPTCRKPVTPRSRFCPHCGAELAPPAPRPPAHLVSDTRASDIRASDIHLNLPHDVHISPDALDLHALHGVISAAVAEWQRRMTRGSPLDRNHAPQAIEELTRMLQSLSAQIAAGQETIRITTRLPTTRLMQTECRTCGAANRATARFCTRCGASLVPIEAPAAPRPLRATAHACSDVGQVRDENEDRAVVQQLTLTDGSHATLLLVADGMGGVAAGGTASELASTLVQGGLDHALTRQPPPATADAWQALLTEQVQHANAAIARRIAQDPAIPQMGTTLTLLVLAAGYVHCAHVGDSRAYLWQAAAAPAERLQRLTTDHTLVARLVEIGMISPADARVHPRRNIIYRSLNGTAHLSVDYMRHPVAAGDVLLVCSDGVTGELDDEHLAAVVTQYAAQPAQLCAILIARANERGGHDNISVALAYLQPQGGANATRHPE